MNDRELIELAAYAAGYECSSEVANQRSGILGAGLWIDGVGTSWQPLQNDADAFRLAVKLGLSITQQSSLSGPDPVSAASGYGVDDFRRFSCKYDGDPLSATRRSIVLAAAEIARQLKANK